MCKIVSKEESQVFAGCACPYPAAAPQCPRCRSVASILGSVDAQKVSVVMFVFASFAASFVAMYWGIQAKNDGQPFFSWLVLALAACTVAASIFFFKNRIKDTVLFLNKQGQLHLHVNNEDDLFRYGAGWLATFDIDTEAPLIILDITGKRTSKIYLWYQKSKSFDLAHTYRSWSQAPGYWGVLVQKLRCTLRLYPGELLAAWRRDHCHLLEKSLEAMSWELPVGTDPHAKIFLLEGELGEAKNKLSHIRMIVNREVTGKSRHSRFAQAINKALT